MKGIDGHKCTMSLSVVRAAVGIFDRRPRRQPLLLFLPNSRDHLLPPSSL
jgi:hypothetical protein